MINTQYHTSLFNLLQSHAIHTMQYDEASHPYVLASHLDLITSTISTTTQVQEISYCTMQYHAIPYNTGNRSHFSNCFNFQKIYLHLVSGRKVINPIVGADFFLQLRPTQLVAVTRTTPHLKIDHLTPKKLRKNCECCPVSQLIVW